MNITQLSSRSLPHLAKCWGPSNLKKTQVVRLIFTQDSERGKTLKNRVILMKNSLFFQRVNSTDLFKHKERSNQLNSCTQTRFIHTQSLRSSSFSPPFLKLENSFDGSYHNNMRLRFAQISQRLIAYGAELADNKIFLVNLKNGKFEEVPVSGYSPMKGSLEPWFNNKVLVTTQENNTEEGTATSKVHSIDAFGNVSEIEAHPHFSNLKLAILRNQQLVVGVGRNLTSNRNEIISRSLYSFEQLNSHGISENSRIDDVFPLENGWVATVQSKWGKKSLCIWDPTTKVESQALLEPIKTLTLDLSGVVSIKSLFYANMFACFDSRGSAFILDLGKSEGNEIIGPFTTTPGEVSLVALDHHTFATSSNSRGTVTLHDIRTGESKSFQAHPHSVISLLNVDGYLLSYGSDKIHKKREITTWDWKNQATIKSTMAPYPQGESDHDHLINFGCGDFISMSAKNFSHWKQVYMPPLVTSKET